MKTPKKPGLLSNIKNLFSYRIQIVHKTGETPPAGQAVDAPAENPAEASLIDPSQADAGAQAPDDEKKKKNKKEKKKKPPKPKKVKVKNDDPDKKGAGKKRIIFIAAGALALCAGAAVFFVLRAGNTPEALLGKATQYSADGEYEKSTAIYEKLLERQELVTDAYLGIADDLVATGDLPGAVSRLQTAYTQTNDPRIEQRLVELAPPGETSAETQEPSDPVIVWKDPAMERMVRLAIGKPSGEIRESDVNSVTTLKILGNTHVAISPGEIENRNKTDHYSVGGIEYRERGGITTLDDLAHFKGLTRLTVGYNSVRDISGVTQLEKLDMLALYANEIEDISAVKDLTGIQYLYLYNNHIRDLTSLAGLSALRELSVQFNEISDISPLAGLINLQELCLENNKIEKIEAVKNLSNLNFLSAQNNLITDIGAVSALSGLTDANFSGNPVRDYSPASHVRNVNLSSGILKN